MSLPISAEKRARIVALLLREPELSTSAIAQRFGCAVYLVSRMRRSIGLPKCPPDAMSLRSVGFKTALAKLKDSE